MLVGLALVVISSLLRCVALAITLHRVDLTDPLAVCNDGSPAAYYYREGAEGAELATWVVHLDAGGWCWDQKSCWDRVSTSPWLISSRSWAQSLSLGGIYVDEGGPFQGAHIAVVSYCSSDAHLGNRGASNETWGWHFRGQAIVEATLRALVRRGLGSTGPSSRLLFGGCSAGARGAAATLDLVRDLLRAEGAEVEVQGFLDAPLWMDIEPFDPQVVPLAVQARGVLRLANASGRILEDCRDAYPGEEWKCVFPEYRLPLLRTRHVVSFSQYDSFQIAWNLGHTLPPESWTAAELDFVEASRRRLLTFLSTLAVPAGSVYFGHACYAHCISMLPGAFDGFTVPASALGHFEGAEVTLLEVTSAWWQGRSPADGRLVDECAGLDCGCNPSQGGEARASSTTTSSSVESSEARASSTTTSSSVESGVSTEASSDPTAHSSGNLQPEEAVQRDVSGTPSLNAVQLWFLFVAGLRLGGG